MDSIHNILFERSYGVKLYTVDELPNWGTTKYIFKSKVPHKNNPGVIFDYNLEYYHTYDSGYNTQHIVEIDFSLDPSKYNYDMSLVNGVDARNVLDTVLDGLVVVLGKIVEKYDIDNILIKIDVIQDDSEEDLGSNKRLSVYSKYINHIGIRSWYIAAIEINGDKIEIELIREGVFSDQLSEIFEPRYPSEVKRGVVKKFGVQGSVIRKKEYKFRTGLGNEVKVHFKVDDNSDIKSADVLFYVNDTLYDDASRIGDKVRDGEILPGVLGIVRKVSDRLGIDEITFEAFSGDGDEKIVKDLPLGDSIEEMGNIVDRVYQSVSNHELVEVDPSERMKELARKLGREPKKMYDFDKNETLVLLNRFIEYLEKFGRMDVDDRLRGYYNILVGLEQIVNRSKNGEFVKRYGLDDMMVKMKGLGRILHSHSGDGYREIRNRRSGVYEKLIGRFFNDWDLEKIGKHYTMTRKNVLAESIRKVLGL